MKPFMPARITKGSFHCCRISVAVLVWAGIITRNVWFLYATAFILGLSALLKVKKAPMVWLYMQTLERLWPTERITVDENALFFAHTVGFIFTVVCIGLISLHPAGWWVTIGLGVLKLSGACGYCSALKLYSCMSSDDCCRVSKRVLGRL